MNRLYQAREFAHAAHDSINQKRKYTGLPYWVHTDEVADIVASVTLGAETPNDESIPELAEINYREMIAAAHLHDTIEDVFTLNSHYDIYLIAKTFGERVAKFVVELTDVYTKEAWPDLNRDKRKHLEAERLGKVSNEAKTIKLADLISNTADIVKNDPDFAKVYLREKERLLPYLVGGSPVLMERAKAQILI